MTKVGFSSCATVVGSNLDLEAELFEKKGVL